MKQNRRKFVKTVAGSSFIASVIGKNSLKTVSQIMLRDNREYVLDTDMRIGAIGMGIMGFNNVRTALSIPGVQLVAVSDLYTGRLDRTKEVFGKQVETFQDYRAMLERNDLDAVIVSTSDHWHDRIAKDVLSSDKHLYLEKPMVHHIEEGKSVIDAEKQTGKKVQIGSQRVSSLVSKKARELYASGILGKLVLAEASFNRQSAMGAWQYSIPRDASPETIDWKGFLGDAPEIPFNAEHFFRWRNYQAYGTGVAGDLFVHLFSAMHYILETNGPEKIFSTGGIRYWKDGRDVPDVMFALFDYPETDNHPAFNMLLKVNFIDGGGGGGVFKLVGTEGVMELKGSEIVISKSKISNAPGYGNWDSFETFTEEQQKEFIKWYESRYPNPTEPIRQEAETVYSTPKDFNAHKAHYMNFFNAILGKEEIIEDATFGLRAAAPSLAANKSYFEKRPVYWNPESMQIITKL